MIPKITKHEIDLGNGKIIQLETGKLAKQADGSVVVKMGKTMLLASVVSNKDANEDMDFLPLTVDYREKFAADGRYPGGFLKREARPSDQEILVMRLVDRVLRPLFPKDYHSETQIMIQLMSKEPPGGTRLDKSIPFVSNTDSAPSRAPPSRAPSQRTSPWRSPGRRRRGRRRW